MQNKPRNILAREREKLAIEYRKDGLSYRKIGEKLGVSDKAVIKMVRKVVGRTIGITNETAEELRHIELERLDRMWEGLWPEAQLGDIGAIRTCLEIQKRRAAYLGLDAPAKATVDIDVRSDIDEQIGRLMERFKPRCEISTPMAIDGTCEPVGPSR